MKYAPVILALLLTCACVQGAEGLPTPGVGKAVTLAASGGSGYQDKPDAAFGGKVYLVVWQDGADGIGEEANILAVRVSADGALLDSKPLVLCAAEKPQRCPRVAWSGEAGCFLVVWEDQRSESPAFDIYAARVSPDGKVLDPNGLPVAQSKDRSQIQPDVAAAPGGFVVAWMEYWTFPTWGIFGARVSKDGKVLDPEGVPLQKRDPAKEIKNKHVLWEQKSYLFPRLASRNGRIWMSCVAPAGIGNPLTCIELAAKGKLETVGKPRMAIFGFTGPRGYGLAIGPKDLPFGTGSANGERGGGHERTFYCEFYDTKEAPQGSAPLKLRAQMPWHNQGRVYGSFGTTAAFDGRYYWVIQGFGHPHDTKRKKPAVSDIIAFRVDPKEHLKPLDVIKVEGASGVGRGSITIADEPTWECHPEVAEGPAGQLLVVYSNDRGPDDCRVQARVVTTNSPKEQR